MLLFKKQSFSLINTYFLGQTVLEAEEQTHVVVVERDSMQLVGTVNLCLIPTWMSEADSERSGVCAHAYLLHYLSPEGK